MEKQEDRMVVGGLRLPRHLWDRAAAIAARKRIKRGTWIRHVIEDAVIAEEQQGDGRKARG